MADIYAFPTGESNDGRPVRPQGVPDEVWAAVESVSTMKRIHDVRYREIPVPSTLADYGIGVEFEAGERALGDAFSAGLGSDAESRIATGWIMMLYAHELRIDWDSNWRCVAFARLPLETAENDSLTPGMYWDDMCDYFDGIEPDSVSGTVTVTQNTAFGSLAADAERASGFRYGHEYWLIQFKREGAGIALLDPVALTRAGADWNEFNDAVGDATWILHDSLMDLPGFAEIGLKPKALFDTEIAARLLGLHRFGLAAVTEHYLGITLAKEHSAADWSYRPLPRDWRNYAALDVEVLIELETMMRRDLKAAGKDEWAAEEFSHALVAGLAPRKPHPIPWLRISRITQLSRDPRGLAIAKSLWEERDRLARQYDIAPSLLLADSSIIEAATNKPHNAAQFRALRSLNERVRIHTGTEQDKMFERYAPIQRAVKPKVWKQAIDRAIALKPTQWPTMPAPEQDENGVVNAPRSMRLWQQRHPERYDRLQRVRRVINRIAEDTRTPAEMIIKPQILRNLCWVEDPVEVDVETFLIEQGARNWQVKLIAPSVSGVIM